MEHLAEEFDRGRRVLARRQGVGRGKRYPAALRSLAIQFFSEASAAGWTASRSAQRLGVSKETLTRWHEQAPLTESAPMQEVVISDRSDEPTQEPVVVVTPDGFRIEGLRGDAVLSTLQALRG